MKRMWSIIVLGFILYAGLVVFLFLIQGRLVYFPIRHLTATPADIGLTYEPMWLETGDGIKLSGWFVPAEPARGTVLFFHGNAGNISHRLDSITIFHGLGLSVLIIDYRGYGQSEGKPSEQGTYLDAEAAWRYLVEERRVAPDEVILFGRSLGGAVAAWLAEQHSPGALILESTFTSVPDIAARYYPFLPVRLLARIRYNTLARLPEINCPVLVVHSPDDDIIPYSHGEQLFAAAPEPKAFLKLKGGHNEGIFVSGQAYVAGLDSFISKYRQ
ncbi:MAG: alpha/beta hydrolase [Anaerolineae bacterium]|nr:alpha/beta hydrolase [Anaerolineae bacterium]